MTIVNKSLSNKTINTSHGRIAFDINGHAEIKDETFALELLELDGYESVEQIYNTGLIDDTNIEPIIEQAKKTSSRRKG